MPGSFRAKFKRRGLWCVVALLAVAAILSGSYQWSVYRRDAGVSDANFQTLPPLGRDARIFILSPHPDDETLGAGGLIAMARSRGIPVRVVFLTNGDGSLATRFVQDAHFVEEMAKGKKPAKPANMYRAIAPMRQRESMAALAQLHVPRADITFLGYPDGGTRAMWETNWNASHPYRSPYTQTDHSPYANSWTPKAPYCGQQVLEDLEQILISFKPTLVITTHPNDTHPDHWAAYAYLNAAVAQLQLQQKYFSWAGKIRCDAFVVHHGLWPAPYGYHPGDALKPPSALLDAGVHWLKLPLDQKARKAKAAALQCYSSQLASTPRFLRSFLRRNELFGQQKTQSISLGNTSPWTPVIHDPVNDLLLSKLVPASNITTLSSKGDGKNLLFKIDLAANPWRALKYAIFLHPVDSKSVTAKEIVIQAGKNHRWGATLNFTNTTSLLNVKSPLNVTVGNRQITVQLPTHFLSNDIGQKHILLISAASLSGQRTLDETPTWIMRH